MSVGKSFGIGLAIYIALNFVMAMISVIFGGSTDLGTWFTSLFTQDWIRLIVMLFAWPFFAPPGVVMMTQITSGVSAWVTDPTTAILTAVLWVVPPLIGSIVTGKMSESPGEAFAGWMLVGIISGVVVLVATFLPGASAQLASSDLMNYILGITGGLDQTINNIIMFLITGVTIGLFYGGIAAMMGREY